MAYPIKHILIGAGKIGVGSHLPALKKLEAQNLCQVAGIVDIDSARAASVAQQFGIPYSGSDWREVAANSGASAVSVCTLPGTNAMIAAEAVAEGFHVLCEKPPGRTLADAHQLAKVAQMYPDRVTMVAFNRRYAPVYQQIAKQSHRIAPPMLFQARFTRPALGQPPSDSMIDWVTSDGAHVLDLAHATIGPFTQAIVWRKSIGGSTPNVWTIHLSNSQATAYVTLNFAAPARVELFEWWGADYEARLELPERAIWTIRGGQPQVLHSSELTNTTESAVHYGFLGEYSAFFDAILGNAPRPDCDFAYAVQYLGLVDRLLNAPDGEPIMLEQSEIVNETSVPCHVVNVIQEEKPTLYLKLPPVAQARYIEQASLATLREFFHITQRSSESKLDDLAGADVILTGWGDTGLSAAEIESAINLKAVIVIGASVQGVQPAVLADRGVALYNTADAIAQGVAEHCLLLALAGLKQLTRVDASIHQGAWPPPLLNQARHLNMRTMIDMAKRNPTIVRIWPYVRPLMLSAVNRVQAGAPYSRLVDGSGLVQELSEQIVGLIGWGHTARHFARLLQPFNCSLLVYSEAPIDDDLTVFGARRASLGEIMGAAKVISLHRGLTDASRGMIGRSELRQIRPGSVLINTARGPLIDEDALLERLSEGDIIAGLDVYDIEPLPRKHPLRSIGNVILTPHYTAQAPETKRRVGQQAVAIALDWRNGGRQFIPLSSSQLSKMT